MDLTGVTLLGKYEIERAIGEGGMGSVWLGVHKIMGRKVAIKLLDDALLKHPEVVERFGREARAASAIQHPGIVEVLDLDQTDDGRPFLVMEHLEGEPLGARIDRKGRLPQDEAIQIMVQLLEALDAAHAHGVVHRDLKPDNIFLTPTASGGEVVKILDFGISHKADDGVKKLTIQGTVLGTPHYMAPEQAMGDAQVDGRTDIYAAGVLLYEALVGAMPFDAHNYNALIHKILTEEAPTPSERGIKLDPHIEEVVMRALSKKREDRPQTAGEMARALLAGNPSIPAAGPPSDTEADQLKPENSEDVPDVSLDLPDDLPDVPNSTMHMGPLDPGETEGLSLDPEFGDMGLDMPEGDVPPLDPADAPPALAPGTKIGGLPWQAKAAAIGFLGIVGIAIVAVGLRFALRRDEPVAKPAAPAASEPAPVPAVAQVVKIDVRGVPAGSTIRLDGLPTSTLPLNLKPGSKHVLEVEANGYQLETVEFTADQDRTLQIRLTPAITD